MYQKTEPLESFNFRYVVSLVILLVTAGYWNAYWLKNPELSAMQVFLDKLWLLVPMLFAIILSSDLPKGGSCCILPPPKTARPEVPPKGQK